MARSLKKGPFIDARLLEKIQKFKAGEKSIVKTWARDCTITPEMIGFSFGVHNGKSFIPVLVTEDMVGHRLGEFSPTTKFVRHGGRMQKEIEAKAAEAGAPGAPAVAPVGATAGKPAVQGVKKARVPAGPAKGFSKK